MKEWKDKGKGMRLGQLVLLIVCLQTLAEGPAAK
jgi:hypothetical protein